MIVLSMIWFDIYIFFSSILGDPHESPNLLSSRRFPFFPGCDSNTKSVQVRLGLCESFSRRCIRILRSTVSTVSMSNIFRLYFESLERQKWKIEHVLSTLSSSESCFSGLFEAHAGRCRLATTASTSQKIWLQFRPRALSTRIIIRKM